MYEKIGNLKSDQYKLNCGYSITQIQDLLKSKNKEDFYFGEILMFYEAILQYNILIEFISKHPDDYLDLLTNTPDSELNSNYQKIISALNL